MKKDEIVFVALLVGGFTIPPVITGQFHLLGTFWIFFVCFGLMELLSIKQTGKSISQNVWKQEKWKKIVIIVGMAIAWVALLIHLWG